MSLWDAVIEVIELVGMEELVVVIKIMLKYFSKNWKTM